MRTGEFYKKVVELRQMGYSYDQIAGRLGTNVAKVDHALCRYRTHGEKIFESKRMMNGGLYDTSDERNAEIVKLASQGMKLKDIAEQTGTSIATASRIINAQTLDEHPSNDERDLWAAVDFTERVNALKRRLKPGDKVKHDGRVLVVLETLPHVVRCADGEARTFTNRLGEEVTVFCRSVCLRYEDLVK